MAQVDDVELRVGSQVRPELRSQVTESCDCQEQQISNSIGNCTGIADRLGIAVAPSRSCPESTRACVAASRGGPRDRDLEEGLRQSATSRVCKIRGQNHVDRISEQPAAVLSEASTAANGRLPSVTLSDSYPSTVRAQIVAATSAMGPSGVVYH